MSADMLFLHRKTPCVQVCKGSVSYAEPCIMSKENQYTGLKCAICVLTSYSPATVRGSKAA